MSEHDDEERQRKTVVHHSRERAFQALELLDEHKPTVPGEVKHQVAVALNSLRRAVRQHRDEENTLDTPWDERDVNVDALDHWLNQTVSVAVPLNRRGNATRTEEVLAVRKVDARELELVAEELFSIAKELGFSEHIDESTHRTEITQDDLKEVEKWRKQNLE